MFHHQPHRLLMWHGHQLDTTKNYIGCSMLVSYMSLAAWVRTASFLFSRDQNPQEEFCCDLERSPARLASRLEQKSISKPDAHTPRRDTTRGFYSRRLFARNNLRVSSETS